MGNIGNQVWEKVYGEKVERVLIIGLDNSGKTTLMYKIKLMETKHNMPTIGFSVETFQHKNITFTCWDLGGQERMRPLWRHYFPSTSGLVFVVDSHDKERMDEAWKEMVSVYKEELLFGVPVLIVMNKSDLEGRVTCEEFVEKYELYDFFPKQNWYIKDTCGITGAGIVESVDFLRSIFQRKRKGQPLEVQPYHSKEYYKVKKIHTAIGWRPNLHILFPIKFRRMVWSLLLIGDRTGLPMDTLKIILSFLEIKIESFQDMKVIADYYKKHQEQFENLSYIKKIIL